MRAAAIAVAAVGAALTLFIGGGGRHRIERAADTASAITTVSPPGSAALPTALPARRSQLMADLGRAEQTIDSPTSSSLEVERAGRFEQLASAALAEQPPRLQHAFLSSLSARAAATIRISLEAAAALGRLGTTHRSLPYWRIVAPPSPATLLRYFRQAQSRFRVPWEYLAAIEFIETKFGRVAGLSSAGAEGPMQFLPATWATYGVGDVHNPRDAILGAARYLVASGAPGDMAGAIYHYNPSGDYVAAVEDYAARMRADSRAYYGYYYWRVIYAKVGGAVILPVGYPRVRPLPLRALLGRWSARRA